MSCVVEKDEFVIGLQAFGHMDSLADLRYFKEFNMEKGVPLIDIVEAWTQFLTNDTMVDKSTVEAIHSL